MKLPSSQPSLAGTSPSGTSTPLLTSEDVPAESWADWKWHMRNAITSVEQLARWIEVSPAEAEAIEACGTRYRFRITPYYASLMDKQDPACPVRRQAIPSIDELRPDPGAEIDPVGDMKYRVTNRVVHKYPDRVIFLVTGTCPVYCRHCTRKFHTSSHEGTYFERGEGEAYDQDFAYLERTTSIRDVLLTGGDPLVYSDERLEAIIRRLRAIPHINIIRIGSRLPVFLPQRITPKLCQMLEKYHPVWLNTHFNHPAEVTDEAREACDRLLRHGVPVGNQTVLLRGVNDDANTMKTLNESLIGARVRPYYLYHCDNVAGVSHFQTSIDEGQQIMSQLSGHMTGFSVPNYIVTTLLGKIPLQPSAVVDEGPTLVKLRNYQGRVIDVRRTGADG